MRLSQTYSGQKRMHWATMKRAGGRAAAIISSHCSTLKAMGFSHSTCLPAFSAATVTSRCRNVGAQMSIMSTFGSAMSALKSVYGLMLPRSRRVP